MAEPCGCGVFIADENSLQGLGDTVKHCPMHAAAGDMLALLNKVHDYAVRPVGATLPTQVWDQLMRDIEAIIWPRSAAARGGVA